MIVGVPKEIKDNEYRVALPPGGAKTLILAGHKVLVQSGAGQGSGFTDEEYAALGAEIKDTAADTWGNAEMVMKVKEPLREEFDFMRQDLLLFTYLHLAAEEELTKALVDRKVPSVAYETVELDNRTLPLLTPMSEVAGRMSVQVGAHYLERANGGIGKLMGGVPGVRPAHAVIIGGGVVGTNAAKMALGMGAQVTIIDINLDRLRYLDDVLHGNFSTVASNPVNIADAARVADLLVGGVLIPGARAPRLVTREMIKTMKAGAVIVDVAIDQGGCVETIKPTTHSEPTYFVDDVLHYGVTNMPGAVPRTSTYALSNATLPYALKLANMGLKEAVKADHTLAPGVNTYEGHVTYDAVAEAFDLEYSPLDKLLN
ncbi:MAG: alanine dehydrogenase [Chloroflexi bacterium]|nr:MAG: alanine dehydrogenase [Chloroflexota bacterium]MBL1192885.1 alanine dehydrogenase [Chloroflexota bacterium]NOH10177.1 alanine dehydrogenase [Chloroflexota bacterium]